VQETTIHGAPLTGPPAALACSATRGLRPQGVGSGGFDSPVLHWFLVVLLVIALIVTHACSVLAADGKEVQMDKTNTNQSAALNKARQFLLSLTVTVWAIGTSAAAGALSA
jgi:hypothetical protein